MYWNFIFYDFLFFREWQERTRCWDQRPSHVVLMELWESTRGYTISAGKLEKITHFTNARSFSPFRQEEIAPGTWFTVFLLPTFVLMLLSLGFALTLTWTLPGSLHSTAMYQRLSGVLDGRVGVGWGRGVPVYVAEYMLCVNTQRPGQCIRGELLAGDAIIAGLREVIRQVSFDTSGVPFAKKGLHTRYFGCPYVSFIIENWYIGLI